MPARIANQWRAAPYAAIWICRLILHCTIIDQGLDRIHAKWFLFRDYSFLFQLVNKRHGFCQQSDMKNPRA
jgi:hypothetical protein